MGYANGAVPAGDGWLRRVLRRLGFAGEVQAVATVPPAGHPPAAVGGGSPRTRAQILVVDDNPVNLLAASEMLSQWGIEPVLAADGAEALALALEVPMDLVLMDLQMPVLNGFQATCQIRKLERDSGRARVPIVAYTMSSQVDEQLLKACGFDDLLRKPCDSATLLECLRRWCGPAAGVSAGGSTRLVA